MTVLKEKAKVQTLRRIESARGSVEYITEEELRRKSRLLTRVAAGPREGGRNSLGGRKTFFIILRRAAYIQGG